MADGATGTPDPGAAPSTAQPGIKYAGRYDTPEAFTSGFAEMWKTTSGEDFDKSKPLFGENGHYPTMQTAEAAYKALQRTQTKISQNGKPSAETGKAPSLNPLEDKAPATNADDDNADPDDIITKAGLSWDDVQKAIVEGGDLTDEQISKIAKARPGLGKGIIKALVKANVDAYQSFTDRNVQLAGGEEGYKTVIEWAKQPGNYSPAELAEKRTALSVKNALKNPAAAASAFKSIMFDMQQAGVQIAAGQPRQNRGMIEGTGRARSGGNGMKNVSELGSTLSGAMRGDKAAIARLDNTPLEDIITMGQ